MCHQTPEDDVLDESRRLVPILRQVIALSGYAHSERVTDVAGENSLAEQVASAPWAGGDRWSWLLIHPYRMTGRRITAC